MLTDENYSQPVQVKIDTTGIYKMMDVPTFKDYLQRNLSSENFRSQEYVNVLNDDNLVDVINLNNKVSYSTLVNKENLVYQVLIYTKKEEKEQMLIAELISEVEIQDFRLNKFTGTIIYKDLNLNILGNEIFENGRSIKSSSKSVCGYVTTAISCASGLHFPGEACAYSGTSGSAYYDTEILNCSGGHAESLDPSFVIGTGFYSLPTSAFLETITLQSDSKILAGGVFSNYTGISQNNIARLRNGTLSVSDVNKKEIIFYPNPVKDIVNFSKEIKTAEIYSLDGRKIIDNIKGKSVDLSKLGKGSYIVQGMDNEGQSFSQKVIKN